jgi:hypothetical protein
VLEKCSYRYTGQVTTLDQSSLVGGPWSGLGREVNDEVRDRESRTRMAFFDLVTF